MTIPRFLRRLSRRQKMTYGSIVVVVVLLILMLAVNMPAALAMVRHAQAGRDYVNHAQTLLLEEQDFAHSAEQLGFAEDEMDAALADLDSIGSWKLIPVVRTQLTAAGNAFTASKQLASGIHDVAALVEQIIVPVTTDGDLSLATLSAAQKRSILQQLYESTPELVRIRSEIDLAAQYVDAIPSSGLLGPVKAGIEPLRDSVPVIQDAIEQFVLASEVLPQIAGYPDEKTYLFLLQNNTELRPTGGFIGTYGILKLFNGEIDTFATDNIYNLDNAAKQSLFIEPPAPIHTYIGSTQWFMRDSNWSPDFPTAAQEALRFYDLEGGTEKDIDGVMAVTPSLIESFLGLTGPITVDGVEFTSENVVDILEYQVEQGFYRQGVSDADRKEIIGDLASELMNQLLLIPQERWNEVWDVIFRDIKEKHLLIYVLDNDLQQRVVEENWSGDIRPVDGDYLMVVDANMASLKSDPGVFRTMNYALTRNGEDMDVTLTIRYENRGTFDWKSTRYRTYTRVYVPQGSTLISSSGVMENDKLHGGRPADPEVYDENGKTVIAGFISIEPQETGELVYTYRLPRYLTEKIDSDGVYTLYAQKQSGTPNRGLTVNATFGQPVATIDPLDSVEQQQDTHVLLSTNLKEDREITVTFK